MNKRRKQQCRYHSAPERSWDEYEFSGQYSHNGTIEVWICIECTKGLSEKIKNYREYLENSWFDYNAISIRIKKENEKKRKKEEKEKKNKKERDELHDNYVRKTILVFVKNSSLMNISEELLQLKRSTIKLNRLIEKQKEKERKLKGILLVCKKHGLLYLKDLIQGGKHRSGEQRYKCRQCMSDTHRNYYERKRNFVITKQAEYRNNNVEKRREINRKSWRKCNGKNQEHDAIKGKSITSN